MCGSTDWMATSHRDSETQRSPMITAALRLCARVCICIVLVCVCRPALAQTSNAPRCGTGVHETESVGTVGFPQDQIFCPIIADPKEPRSFASLLRGTF